MVELVRGLLDLLWPPRTACLLCRAPLSGTAEGATPAPSVCRSCWDSVPFPPELDRCPVCLRPTMGESAICRDCEEGTPYGRVWALGLHHRALREAIHHFKFNGRLELAVPLGRRLAGLITDSYDLVVPMPLHTSRLRERGFNQAALLSAEISAILRAPHRPEMLVRLRNTGHQAKLDRSERLRNLDGAFAVARDRSELPGRRVLLVDDVLTTGATAAAAATSLLAAGCASVNLAVLAVSTTAVRKAETPKDSFAK